MGWTTIHVDNFNLRRIYLKEELDLLFKNKPLYSTMRGSVYYAAVQLQNGNITGVVIVTRFDSREYYNFSYKIMDETFCPFYYDCPKKILDMLSPTENESALVWRMKCREKLEAKKNPNSLSNLPVGSVIQFTDDDGNKYQFYKHPPEYQFKRNFWMNVDNTNYVKRNAIPNDYEVIKRGDE